MNTVLVILLIASVGVLIAALVKPSLLRQASRKRAALIFGSLALMLFVLVGVTNHSSPAPLETDTASVQSELVAAKTDQQKFEATLGSLINGTHGGTDTSYKSMSIDSATKMLTVSVNVSSFYDRTTFIKDTGSLSAQIFQTSYPSYLAPTDVVVQYYGQTTDSYGNKQSSVVATYSTDKTTYSKINWANFDTTKLCDFLQSETPTDDHNACTVVAGLQ